MRSPALLLNTAITLFAATGMAAYAAEAGVDVKPTFTAPIPNITGKSLTTVTVAYAPGGKSVSHRHANSAYIYAYVLEGEIRSQVDAEPVRVYRAGEFWTENPGAHHVISENASTTNPARLLAVFVVDTADSKLVTPD